MCVGRRRVIASATRLRDVGAAAQREQRRSGSRQAAAERARVRGGALDRREPGTSGARRGSAIVSSSERRQQIEVAAVQRVDERAEVRPLLHGVGERHVSPSSARAFAVSISRSGWTTTAVEPGRHRQADDVGRVRARGRARSRRRSTARCCRRAPSRRRAARLRARRRSACPAARARRAARRPRRPPPPRSRRCRRGRSTAAGPCGSSSDTPRRSPSARQQRQRRDAGGVPGRLARQPAVVARRCRRCGRPPAANAAVTSSPGSCSAKPSTSKPQATFETVAGANAVTERHER